MNAFLKLLLFVAAISIVLAEDLEIQEGDKNLENNKQKAKEEQKIDINEMKNKVERILIFQCFQLIQTKLYKDYNTTILPKISWYNSCKHI